MLCHHNMKYVFNSHFQLAITLCFAQFFFTTMPVAQAQEIEEVIIEAEIPQDQVLDDLVSVSAIDAEKLADAGIENVEDVAAYVPNLVLSETDVGTNIVIRGIGAGTNQGFDQSVGLYIDGVPYPRANMARAPFLDLSGVQVLRGPQYVLDGNYSIAGSVHLLTNSTLDEFSAGFDVNYIPSQNDKKILITAGLPMSDTFGVRFALQSQKSDGYIENVFKEEDGPQKDDLIARTVFSWKPTDNLSFNLKAERGQYDRVGRQIEIFLNEKTPDPSAQLYFDDFPGFFTEPENEADRRFIANPNYQQFVAREPSDRTKALRRFLLTDTDLAYLPLGGDSYDSDTTFIRSDGSIDFLNEYAYAGKSYLETLAQLYRDGRSYRLEGPTVVPFSNPAPVPTGLTDGTLNYKRSTDYEEFSTNNSENYTLNTELWIGEHQFKSISSYIAYDFDEQVDIDFTPVPFLQLDQDESYSQIFQKIEYQSPTGNFLEVKAGASYLKGELAYRVYVDLPVSEKDLFPNNSTNTSFDINEPIRAWAGLTQTSSNLLRSFEHLGYDLQFKQDNEIFAGYLQATMHWSDTFRSTFGLRYTYSEKCAIRDSALVDKDDPTRPAHLVDAISASDAQLRTRIFNSNIKIFGIQSHTDRYADPNASLDCRSEAPAVPNPVVAPGVVGPNRFLDPIGLTEAAPRGTRIEEKLLPSLSLEWDVTPDITTLASVRLANKLGGFDALSNTTPTIKPGAGGAEGTFEFEDEDAISYELGVRWLHSYGQLSATAFYTDYTNLQVSRSDGKLGQNVDNAGAANSKGIELEGNLQITDAFSMNYSAAWIDFTFEEFLRGSCYLGRRADNYIITGTVLQGSLQETVEAFNGVLPIRYDLSDQIILQRDADGTRIGHYDRTRNRFQSVNDAKRFRIESVGVLNIDGEDIQASVYNAQQTLFEFDSASLIAAGFCDFAGQTNQYVAEWQGTFSFNYEAAIANSNMLFKPSLDILYNSGYFTDNTQDPDAAQPEYFQFNGRVAISDDEGIWEAALTGENLTNEKIVGFAQRLPISTGTHGSKGYYGFIRPPRSIGLNFRYNFF